MNIMEDADGVLWKDRHTQDNFSPLSSSDKGQTGGKAGEAGAPGAVVSGHKFLGLLAG